MEYNTNMALARAIIPILKDYAMNRHGLPGTFIEDQGQWKKKGVTCE